MVKGSRRLREKVDFIMVLLSESLFMLFMLVKIILRMLKRRFVFLRLLAFIYCRSLVSRVLRLLVKLRSKAVGSC